MEQGFTYLVPLLGLVGLIAMAIKSAWVNKQDTGDANMIELSGYIAKGAMAFLKAEWKVLSYFAIIAVIVLAWSGLSVETSSPIIAVSFIIGAVFSAFAGYIGMKVAKSQCKNYTGCKNKFTKSLKSFLHWRICYGFRCCRLGCFRYWSIIHRFLSIVCG